MKITILSPGKIREKWLQAGVDEYIKRLGRYCQVDIRLVDDVPDSWPTDKAVAEEGRRLLSRIGPQDFVIALDLNGHTWNSPQLAVQLSDWFRAGGSEVYFLIGGSNGLSPDVLARANQKFCLSQLTFTHQMTRLILLEQCYRAFRILRNEPYHK